MVSRLCFGLQLDRGNERVRWVAIAGMSSDCLDGQTKTERCSGAVICDTKLYSFSQFTGIHLRVSGRTRRPKLNYHCMAGEGLCSALAESRPEWQAAARSF